MLAVKRFVSVLQVHAEDMTRFLNFVDAGSNMAVVVCYPPRVCTIRHNHRVAAASSDVSPSLPFSVGFSFTDWRPCSPRSTSLLRLRHIDGSEDRSDQSIVQPAFCASAWWWREWSSPLDDLCDLCAHATTRSYTTAIACRPPRCDM